MSGYPYSRGFTLIEVMIVVAIVAILSAIAYPMYTEQVMRMKRSDAYVGLGQIMQLQEEYFLRNYSYAGTLSALGLPNDTIDSPDLEYDLTLINVLPDRCTSNNTNPCTSFSIEARPNKDAGQSTSQSKDEKCQVIVIDSIGRKTAQDANGGDTDNVCWGKK